MKILPDADPSDGSSTCSSGATCRRPTWRGTCTSSTGDACPHPKARIVRARSVTVTPEVPLPIEVDGEGPGITPATFTVVPSALLRCVPGGAPGRRPPGGLERIDLRR